MALNETEFNACAIVELASAPALLALLTERCGAGVEGRLRTRRYASRLPKEKRGPVGELSLLDDEDGVTTLRAKAVCKGDAGSSV